MGDQMAINEEIQSRDLPLVADCTCRVPQTARNVVVLSLASFGSFPRQRQAPFALFRVISQVRSVESDENL